MRIRRQIFLVRAEIAQLNMVYAHADPPSVWTGWFRIYRRGRFATGMAQGRCGHSHPEHKRKAQLVSDVTVAGRKLRSRY